MNSLYANFPTLGVGQPQNPYLSASGQYQNPFLQPYSQWLAGYNPNGTLPSLGVQQPQYPWLATGTLNFGNGLWNTPHTSVVGQQTQGNTQSQDPTQQTAQPSGLGALAYNMLKYQNKPIPPALMGTQSQTNNQQN